jgi:transglutaminase/protease-like cytokinesis protein 3
VCRNYDAIDTLAMSINVKTTRMGPSISAPTIEDYLKPLLESAAAASLSLKEATDALTLAWEPYEKAKKAYEPLGKPHEKLLDQVNAAIRAQNAAQDELRPLQAPDATTQPEKLSAAKKKVEDTTAENTKLRKQYEKNEIIVAPLADKLSKATLNYERFQKAKEGCKKKSTDANSVADKAVREVAQRLLRGCGFNSMDPINRARFFFTWIASTVKYNEGALKLGYRAPISTVVNGYEVCAGYAELFKIMFNTHTDTGAEIDKELQCIKISGWAKTGLDRIPKEEYKKHKHAWNAFPVTKSGPWKVRTQRDRSLSLCTNEA